MSRDEELPPAETEITSKASSSTVQNLTQDEPETGPKPDSDLSLPQDENDNTSKNKTLPTNEGVNNLEEVDTGTSKHGSASHEIKPVENESSKDSDNTIQAAETRKQDPDDIQNLNKNASPQSAEDDNTSKISSPPAQDSSVDKQEAGGTKTSCQDSEPSVQEIPPAQDENESKKPVTPEDNVSQTSKIRSQEIENSETSKRDSVTSIDPQPMDTTPIENAVVSTESSPPEYAKTHSMQTKNQEIDHSDVIEDHPHEQDVTESENEVTARHASSPNNAKTSTEDSESSVQDIPPAQDENVSEKPVPPEDNVSETSKLRSQETEDTEASKRDSVTSVHPQPMDTTPIENAAISTESSPPEDDDTHAMQTRNQETDHTDVIEDHPHEQDVTQSENEANTRHASSPNNHVDSRQKKSSSWKKLRRFFSFKRSKESPPKSQKSITGPSEDNALPNLIRADIESVREETKTLKRFNDHLVALNDDAEKELKENKDNHGELRKSMIKLKLLIPSQIDVNSDAFKTLQSRLTARKNIPQDLLGKMPQLHKNENFYCSPETKDFEVLYERLDSNLRHCLLCFSIFPGNETIRKRLMMRWWLTEDLSNEDEVNNHFDKLREEGFIVPVNNNRSLNIGRYRMHPLYQSMLKMLAEKAKFFNFDDKGKPTQNYTDSFQACLVGEGLLSYDDLQKEIVTIDGLEKIHLLMNLEESILDFKLQWFSMMRNVNVLYLGRWQASDAAHIEVEETNFLDGLKNTNAVKFLSLQGISNIIKLSESILALKRLECLDLRACHNLESIPLQIGVLTRLTHLDMSECYLLDHMPKSLSKLKNLRVFKGFVVSHKNSRDPCTLADLKELEKLTKLCIYTTLKHFPNQEHVSYLENIENLRKLSIAWGGEALKREKKDDTSNASDSKGDTSKTTKAARGGETSKAKVKGDTSKPSGDTIKDGTEKEPSKLLSKLEKLDLKCFPMKATPSWLKGENSVNLKKLYIRGGRFSDLGQYQSIDHSHTSPQKNNVWKVEILRLKYLSDLEMEWRQLHELFPDLVYLEQISCPKLTLFNCAAGGVWINQTRLKAWEETQVSARATTEDKPAE